MLEPGTRAALVILDRHPLEVDPVRIRDTEVLKTFKDGRTLCTAVEATAAH